MTPKHSHHAPLEPELPCGLDVRVDALEGAFPDKDMAAHYQYHVEQAAKSEKSKKFHERLEKLKLDLVFDLAKLAVKGLAGGIVALILIGSYTKFGELVNKVVDTPRASSKDSKDGAK